MSILVHLKTIKNLSPAENNLSEYILKHPQKVTQLSVRDLSELTYTSPATIVRFSKKICNGGFAQMKIQIASEMNLFCQSSFKLEDNLLTSPSFSVNSTSKNLSHLLINSLNSTNQMLDFHVIESIVEQMSNYDFIDMYGIGSSHIVGKDFYYKLTRIGKNAHIDQGNDMQLLRARNSNESRLSFVISYSGMTKEMLDICKTLVRVGSPIVSLTGNKDSSISSYATYTLYVSDSEPIIRVGCTASRTCMNYILDLIFLCYYNKNYEHSLCLIEKTHIEK